MNSNVLTYANNYLRSGLSPIPIRCDGSKAPAIPSWKPYQERQATASEMERWFGNGKLVGIGLVCGYGGLWVLDLDDHEVANRYCRSLEEAWPECWRHLSVIETPRPGRQLMCRLSSTPPGSQRYALRREGNQIKAMIESRGSGSYVVTVGSPSSVHTTGRAYRHMYGCSIERLQPIEKDRVDYMRSLARMFSEMEIQQAQFVQSDRYSGEPRPGDIFNHHADWKQLLGDQGWQLDHEQVRPLCRSVDVILSPTQIPSNRGNHHNQPITLRGRNLNASLF